MAVQQAVGVTSKELDSLAINTIRTLAMDAVQQANSGHPGTPMAMAPVVYCLWQNFLRFDPDDPIWPNRDRFVLSIGHASMLLYSVLHLAGVKAVDPEYETLGELSVKLEDLKRFRQLDSKCPGHPEYRWTSGVETTTGPLGQGVATSVGMAIASRWLASYFNRPGFEMFNFNAFALCGDGDMMEGISGEAASLAGHLRLSNLCWIYDNNHITIEGNTALAFDDDVATRFIGYGWNVTRVGDANDQEMLARAFTTFLNTNDRPTLIIVDSHIAYGAPNKQDTSAAHGEPLGEDEIRLAKRSYGWPENAKFYVPDGVREHFRFGIGRRGRTLREEWTGRLQSYKKQYPELAAQMDQIQRRELPAGWDKNLPTFPADAKGVAGRDSSAKVLNTLAQNVPWLVGGAADLAPSTKTRLTFDTAGDFEPGSYQGRNLHFGIREHAMGAVLNGMSLSKVRPFGSGFLIFSDYSRPAIRLAAIMEIPVIYIFTHDSIGVGEDGPTHQPIEHIAALRLIPHLDLWRPCDAVETAAAWRKAIARIDGPTLLVLTRQACQHAPRDAGQIADIDRGGYVLIEPAGEPEAIVIATGSEVGIAAEAVRSANAQGRKVRLVSLPSTNTFDSQDAAYKERVLPSKVTRRVAVEAGVRNAWWQYVGLAGEIVGIDHFGASAPGKVLFDEFGFTTATVSAAIDKVLAQ